MTGERTVYDILTGQQRPARSVAAPAPEPGPAERRIELLEEAVTGTLAYLRLTPEERAKQEAGELLSIEKQARDHEAAQRAQAEQEVQRLLHLIESQREDNLQAMAELRGIIANTQDESAMARASVESAKVEQARLAQTLNAERQQHRAQLDKLRSRQPIAPVTEPAIVLKPSDIQFVYTRNENRLLRHVTLRAKGYDDLVIDIERGSDNRMREIRVRNQE